MSKEKLEIKWIPAVGSSLGAVTSAVVLSTLGVGGTLVGAAVGSLVITIGGSVYSQSLQKTKDRVGERVDNERNHVRQRNDKQEQPRAQGAESVPVTTGIDEPVTTSTGTTRGVLRGLPWKRILGVTVALFAVAMALILAFELTAGRSVSSITGGTSGTGGTSIPGVGNPRGETDESGTTDPDKNDPKQDEGTNEPEQEQKPQESDGPTPQDQMPEQDQAPEQAPVLVPQDQAPEQNPALAPQK